MITRLLILQMFLLFTSQVVAIELTVNDCVRLGLEQNEELKALGAEVEISKQDSNIAYADLFPSISLESTYSVRDQAPHFTLEADLFGQGFPPNDTNVEGEKEHYTVGFRLIQPLYTGGRLSGTHLKQNLLSEARRHQFAAHSDHLTYQIKRSFFHALSRRHVLSGTTEATRAQVETLRVLQELSMAGKVTSNEILAAESDLLFTRADELNAAQAYQNALDDLFDLIGMDAPAEIKESDTYTTLSPDFEISDSDVLDERNDVKRLNAQVNAADEDIQVARSGYYPQLTLEASYLNQRETDITEDVIWEAGVKLDWSLFEGGKTEAEIAKAKAEQLRLKHLRNGLQRSVVNEVKSALRLVRSNEVLVEAHRLQLLGTEQELVNVIELHRSGEKRNLDVLNSQTKLVTANATYRAAINQLRTSIVALEKALASPLGAKLLPHGIYHPDMRTQVETTPATALPSSDSALSTQTATNRYPYSIQLGSFRSEDNARIFMNKLRKDYPENTFERISTSGWLKIRATQFATRKDADKALVAFKGKGIIIYANTNDTRSD